MYAETENLLALMASNHEAPPVVITPATPAAVDLSAVKPPVLFNGRYTLENSETGEHRTFSVKTQDSEAKFAPGKRIVALLTGPDNTSDYQPFGFVTDAGVSVWLKKCGTAGKPSAFEIYADMIAVLAGKLPSKYGKTYAGYAVLLERRCLVCNRPLTTPDSIRAGIGPICAAGGGY